MSEKDRGDIMEVSKVSEKDRSDIMEALKALPEKDKQFVLGYAAGVSAIVRPIEEKSSDSQPRQ